MKATATGLLGLAVGEWVGAWTLDAFRLHALAGCCIVHAACASQAGAQRNLFLQSNAGGYWEDGGAAVLLAAVGGPVGVRGRHVLAPILPRPSSKRCLRRRGAAYDRTTNSNLFIARPSPSSFRFPLHPRSPISAFCATPSSKMHTANLE
jgi:hypothetical protein